MLTFHLKTSIVGVILFAVVYPHSIFQPITVETPSTLGLPQIQLNQTANIKVVFLGVPSEHVDEGMFLSHVPRNVSQFAHPNNMTWTLNLSIAFHEFPESVMTSLIDNAYLSEGTTYYNITLLDELLSQLEYLTIPTCGYLTLFMWIPDGAIDHSWFYVQERPDLFLGRIDYFNSIPFKYWAFPQNFGGKRSALYFDISDIIEKTSTKQLVTNTIIKLFKNGLADIFTDLLGAEDSRMIAADMQKYENYTVEILWLNGTGEQFYSERIKESFEDLMPWTNWTITIKTRAMDATLNNLIESRTEELPEPLTYSFLLSNGSGVSIEAWRNVKCDFLANSGEYDPLIRYFFDYVEDYFNLTDLEDKSIIPVVFLQLKNDTTIGYATQAGVSWFLHNIIIVGFQGSAVTAIGESGHIFLTHLLRHEIGHWVSLSHHSEQIDLDYPKIICSMRSITNRFCTFCKDARARMSFISYYKATTETISNNQAKIELLRQELEDALQLFYDWKYTHAVKAIISVYHKAQTPILLVEITANPEVVQSGGTSNITVNVTDGVSPVFNVTITLLSEKGGAFSPEIGKTDSNGSFVSILTAPSVTEQTIYIITANATKTGYLSGQNQTQVTVNPSMNDFIWIWLAILVVIIIIGFVLLSRKNRGKRQ